MFVDSSSLIALRFVRCVPVLVGKLSHGTMKTVHHSGKRFFQSSFVNSDRISEVPPSETKAKTRHRSSKRRWQERLRLQDTRKYLARPPFSPPLTKAFRVTWRQTRAKGDSLAIFPHLRPLSPPKLSSFLSSRHMFYRRSRSPPTTLLLDDPSAPAARPTPDLHLPSNPMHNIRENFSSLAKRNFLPLSFKIWTKVRCTIDVGAYDVVGPAVGVDDVDATTVGVNVDVTTEVAGAGADDGVEVVAMIADVLTFSFFPFIVMPTDNNNTIQIMIMIANDKRNDGVYLQVRWFGDDNGNVPFSFPFSNSFSPLPYF